ncbi:nicotinate phosphoribosyltransferase [Conservatibacter flavescens]|uniref:Nicotinamide phosphoribosyltransferase n=1 Tax=Conservatibacter flavescens TaxID=28161 RepID=A0A2M8S052_9PAST|nr:nicotinate phosphoribosyltransferase [Conservatibacter flavescens]PJG84523.1 nicotinate phosphoribosyltransferase [Conservatibacter flavescens]
MFHYNPLLLSDFYKQFHRKQYPKDTQYIYSVLTPRTSKKLYHVSHVVSFGYQAFIKRYLMEYFDQYFFQQDKQTLIEQYKQCFRACLNMSDETIDTHHLVALHDLGYLPLEIKAIPEGKMIPIKNPLLTIRNTDPRFFWLTNYLETLLLTSTWLPTTSATIAAMYRSSLQKWGNISNADLAYIDYQAHDFSMRGLSSLESAALSGAAHLIAFKGTDVIPAIHFVQHYYPINNKMLIGSSIPATEHSVMCIHGRDELATFEYLITQVYPTGTVSIVSDSYDFWHNIRVTLPALKTLILAREGKVVIRPDSGDPMKIICGNPQAKDPTERIGLIAALYHIFGGQKNAKGFIKLDPHIGVIYGDSINLELANQIIKKLISQGFAASNIVFGIGSLAYQQNSRDSLGLAVKATHAVVNGEERLVFKDPKTDHNKRSPRGMVKVLPNGDFQDGLGLHSDFSDDQLHTIFYNGEIRNSLSFEEVRSNFTKDLISLGEQFQFTLP